MANDKWTMFKNSMHNELAISKEDIRVWVKEAVHEEARKMLANTFEDYSVRDIIKVILKDEMKTHYGFKSEIKQYIAKEMVEQLSLSVKEDHIDQNGVGH